jgi:D-alanyl-D-alanine carboxypeptidase (penicillin-binding protein 5/6)
VASNFFSRRQSLRGLWTRLFAMLAGAALSTALIVGMQLPLLHPTSHAELTLRVSSQAPASLAWPRSGSAALLVPSLGVRLTRDNRVMPIASLTKMMTAYVVLKKLPLAVGQTGPCLTVSANDVATYQAMIHTDQSNALVSVGEQLCELDLLDGLLVHSANNYSVLLANMVAGSTANFIALMNQTAGSLGFVGTHYVDTSGYDPGSVSTALDQGLLAQRLMASPLVRSIVSQTSVTLPVAGTVGSYTPYVGIDHVIGVKSGRTLAAGGCDVLAMQFLDGTSLRTVYSVVLDQRGGDLLGPAGSAALALAQSAVAGERTLEFAKGRVVGRLGWTQSTPVVVGRSSSFHWWPAQGNFPVTARIGRFTTTVRRGERVGWLFVHATKLTRIALVASATISPPSLWQRLR